MLNLRTKIGFVIIATSLLFACKPRTSHLSAITNEGDLVGYDVLNDKVRKALFLPHSSLAATFQLASLAGASSEQTYAAILGQHTSTEGQTQSQNFTPNAVNYLVLERLFDDLSVLLFPDCGSDQSTVSSLKPDWKEIASQTCRANVQTAQAFSMALTVMWANIYGDLRIDDGNAFQNWKAEFLKQGQSLKTVRGAMRAAFLDQNFILQK